jgi:hypothetical protein
MPNERTNEEPRVEAGTKQREETQRLEQQIERLPVADHVLLMMHSLSALAVDRLGLVPETVARRDLEQARLAIDAFKALMGTLEGRCSAEEMTAHRSVLSQLQLAYVGALEKGATAMAQEPDTATEA